jgi:porin
VNRFTGSTQQVNDDADGDRGLSVPQLWYRHHFLDRKLSLQIGYMDYQTIVDRNVYANSEDKQFMNAVFDNNPAIPTASAAGLGAALYFRPCEYYTLIVGGADAQRLPLYKPGFSTTFHDEAWFLGYMEHTIHVKIPTERGPMKGNYRFGMVYDPIPRSVYVPAGARATQEGDDYGFYCSFDQQLFRESDQDEQGLGAFARYSYRHDDTPHDAGFFNQFWSTGLAYKGLVPTRDRDTLGLAVGQLLRSSQYEANVNSNASQETMYELYYAIELTPWLVVTPDIQYIDNPGGLEQDGISHAIAGGVRVRVTF